MANNDPSRTDSAITAAKAAEQASVAGMASSEPPQELAGEKSSPESPPESLERPEALRALLAPDPPGGGPEEECREVKARLQAAQEALVLARRETPLRAVPDTCFRLSGTLEILGYKIVPGPLPIISGDMVGRPMGSVLPGQVVAAARAAMEHASAGALGRADCTIRIKGREHHFEARVMPLADGETLLVVRDITDLKRLERDALTARKAAEEASQAKSDFLATMSHEIRTPLSGIVGLTDLALSQVTGEKERGYLLGVKESLRSMLSIINDILDFSKIEARRLKLKAEPFDLRAMLASAVEPFQVEAGSKGIGLALEIAPRTPCALMGDELRLKQVITNLVSNAIKFTEQGGVAVRVEEDEFGGPEPGYVFLRFLVSDTGVGIDPGKHGAIFEKFVQAGVSTAKEFDGTGLGLPICKSIVEMMGGAIWVESEPGRGSDFTFTVVMGRQEEPQEQPGKEEPAAEVSRQAPTGVAGQGARPGEPGQAGLPGQAGREEERPGETFQVAQEALDILLAEDNDINRMLAVEFLQAMGHTVTAVRDGIEAVQALQERGFDVVLLDISMPRLDGYEVIEKIRVGEVQGADPAIPVVALTAFAMDEDRKRILESGADAYLPKPLDTTELANVLDVVARRKKGRV